MATYTGIADANGDFTIPFSRNYTSGQKVTVKALKDGAEKSIELFAPSDVTGGGAIQFSGSLNDFPLNIGDVTIMGLTGVIQDYAFEFSSKNYAISRVATGLTIEKGPVSIGQGAFSAWNKSKKLIIPDSVESIGVAAFYNWSALLSCVIPDSVITIASDGCRLWTSLVSLTIGSGVKTLGNRAFDSLTACEEIIVKPIVPPTIESATFANLKSTCVIKVPLASLSAYQTATNWSVHASKMVGV